MATVNKDFKIKSGLIVEGATGTINGNNILTETASDTYILNLIGGETLVKSVSSEFDVSVAGELSLDRAVVDAYYDAAGDADQALLDANSYTDTGIFNALETAAGYADTAEADAKSYADGLASNYDAAGSATTAENNAKSYADSLAPNYDASGTAAALISDSSNASDKVWSAYKTSTEIGLAQSAAETFATQAIADLVDSAPATLDTLNELAAALQDNPDIIGDLQDIAAGKQDTLTAGQGIMIDTVNSVDNTIHVHAGDGLTFGNSGLAIDYSTVDYRYDTYGAASMAKQEAISDAALDATSKANTAESNANSYTDTEIGNLTTVDIPEGTPGGGLYFTDARAITAIDAAITGGTQTNISVSYNTGTSKFDFVAENGVADSTTDDLAEGEENLYFLDERAIDAVSGADIYPNAVIISNLTKHVANQVTVATAGIATGISWAKADYRSAEFVVKVAYGDHTEISKVLMTLDVNDNISITEYGNVTTNGSASTVSADISGTDARLRVTTVNNNSTVTVIGTLIA